MTNWNTECGKVHGSNWLKWLGHLKGMPVRGFEVGTWEGDSAAWMIENIFTHEEATYDCIDTFQGSDEHRLAGIDCSQLERKTRYRLYAFRQSNVHKGYSSEWMKARVNAFHRFDFAYIDAAHDAMNVMRDSVLAFELVKSGGIIIWDDYTWNVMPHVVDRPKMAIDAFLDCYARHIEVIGMGYQVAIRKL